MADLVVNIWHNRKVFITLHLAVTLLEKTRPYLWLKLSTAPGGVTSRLTQILYNVRVSMYNTLKVAHLTVNIWHNRKVFLTLHLAVTLFTLQAGPFPISSQSTSWHLSMKSKYYEQSSKQIIEASLVNRSTYPSGMIQMDLTICTVPIGP